MSPLGTQKTLELGTAALSPVKLRATSKLLEPVSGVNRKARHSFANLESMFDVNENQRFPDGSWATAAAGPNVLFDKRGWGAESSHVPLEGR
jgi:hypothetical protein